MTILDLQIYSIQIDESLREVIQLEIDDGYELIESYLIPKKQKLVIIYPVELSY